MDSIQIKAWLPNDDCTDTVLSDITIKCLGYDEKEKDIMYRYDLPKRLYDKLVDTQTKFRSYQNYLNNKKEIEKKGIHTINFEDNLYLAKHINLAKHITGKLISSIINQIDELAHEAVRLSKRGTLQKTKKIFVRFNSSTIHDRHISTGGYKGEKISTTFQFFVGYEVNEEVGWLEDKKNVTNYYTLIAHKTGSLAKFSTNFKEGNNLEPLHQHNTQARSEFVDSHHIIDWTQEREDFFNRHILDKFKELDERLKNYFANLDEDKINLLMSDTSSQKLLKD